MTQQLLPRTTETTALDLTEPVRAFIDAVNAGDMTAAVDQLSADAVHHGQIASYRPEGVKVLFNMLRAVLPDMRMEIREIRVDGDRVTTKVVGTGSHTGAFLGRAPSGRPIVWQMVDIATVRSDPAQAGGRPVITERYWDVFADPYAWQEIGVIPAIMC